MPQRSLDQVELLRRRSSQDAISIESSPRGSFDLENDDFDSHYPSTSSRIHPRRHQSSSSTYSIARLFRRFLPSPARKHGWSSSAYHARPQFPKKVIRLMCWFPACLASIVFLLALLTALFNPSYTHLPPHYSALADLAVSTGKANPNNEKVYIAANIIDPDLIRGAWGEAVLGLIEVLGHDNVFLSVYENDSGPETTKALQEFASKVPCESAITSEHLDLDEVPTVTLPSGEKRIKRVAYLAEVRNRALRPLDHRRVRALNDHTTTERQYDKILFVNDVVFAPLDAAQLLFSTNVDNDKKTQYRAACAVDFINPFKFYDTFATRDLEGYGMGVPFFPWFSNAGEGLTRKDVLSGTDAVRVRSCWGGMVAFDAKWLQYAQDKRRSILHTEAGNGYDSSHAHEARSEVTSSSRQSSASPIRFRSELDPFWDSSECCLINADIQKSSANLGPSDDVGIFVNPYIRVGYSQKTFSWLGLTRRFERLYTIPHHLVNRFAGLPYFNPRRTEQEGTEVEDEVWQYDNVDWQDDKDIAGSKKGGTAKKLKGSYQKIKRIAGRGGFCGSRMLLVLKVNPKEGEQKWEKLPIPPA